MVELKALESPGAWEIQPPCVLTLAVLGLTRSTAAYSWASSTLVG